MAFRIGSNMGGLHGTSRREPAVRTYVRIGHGVEPSVVPRVASGHSADRQPASASRAVPFECLERVGRARRVEAAPGREVSAHQPPRADRERQDPGHGAEAVIAGIRVGDHEASGERARASAAERVSKLIVAADASAPMRYAVSGASRSPWTWTAARSRLRKRLRATALPVWRPTAYATAGGPARCGTERIPTGPVRRGRAWASASNVARSRTRQIRRRVACDRADDGTESPRVRLASASGF